MRTKNTNTDFQFISDSPIEANQHDELFFGYQAIAETLGEIIEKCPTPFTIGIFGKWGTGKSTILNQLENYLNSDSIFVTFDIWKYESDYLRRSFLLDVVTQLKNQGFLNNKVLEKIKEKLYLSISRPKEQFKFSYRALIIFLLITLAVFFAQLSIIKTLNWNTIYSSLISGLIGSLSELIRTTISVDRITLNEDRINSPEEFEREFENVLTKIDKKKLIIAIDNLDRVDRDKAVELLGTIKTFLSSEKSNNKVVFIIPCDSQSIKEYLKSVYLGNIKKSNFDPDEFLRKFFNTVFRIPKFLNLELDQYTNKLLNQTKVKLFRNNTDLQRIINSTFRDNPREIKQFINNLITYYLFAQNKIARGELDKSFINKNVAFIAKLLIIRQKFPNIYEAMEEKALREATTWSEFNEVENLNKLKGLEEKEVIFEDFIKSSNWIKPIPDNIALFFTLRRSDEERSLAGWDQYIDAAINARVEIAVKLIKKLKQ